MNRAARFQIENLLAGLVGLERSPKDPDATLIHSVSRRVKAKRAGETHSSCAGTANLGNGDKRNGLIGRRLSHDGASPASNRMRPAGCCPREPYESVLDWRQSSRASDPKLLGRYG